MSGEGSWHANGSIHNSTQAWLSNTKQACMVGIPFYTQEAVSSAHHCAAYQWTDREQQLWVLADWWTVVGWKWRHSAPTSGRHTPMIDILWERWAITQNRVNWVKNGPKTGRWLPAELYKKALSRVRIKTETNKTRGQLSMAVSTVCKRKEEGATRSSAE